jgi:hypothetical protein
MQQKKYPKYLSDFVKQLQINLAFELKKTGKSTRKGHISITNQIEKYLIRKYKISKRMKNSDILVKFGLDQNVIRNHHDNEPSKITNFKFKLGNKAVCKYTTLVSRPLDKCFTVNPVFHWEFLREVQMNEFSETETAFRHEQLVEEQRARKSN